TKASRSSNRSSVGVIRRSEQHQRLAGVESPHRSLQGRYPVASDPLSGSRRTDMMRALGVFLIALVLAACGDSGGGGGGNEGATGIVGGPGTTVTEAGPQTAAVWCGA